VALEAVEAGGGADGVVARLVPGLHVGRVLGSAGVPGAHDDGCPPQCDAAHRWHTVRFRASASGRRLHRRLTLDLEVDLRASARSPTLEALRGMGPAGLAEAWVLLSE